MRAHRIPRLAAVAAASLAAAACGGGSDDGASRGPNTVVMEGIEFAPKALTVKAGSTVTWINEDDVQHNVVAESEPKLKSELFGKGGEYRYKTTEAGTIAYVCTVHPGMQGTLTVK